MTDNTLHTRYRPADLSQLLGHATAVTRLKGMINTGKIPGAILFTGPSSVGKTTLARALAAAINGKPVEQQTGDYKELNAGDQRSIEDMRELIKLSKFRPSNKKRIFVIDEAQMIVTNKAAATCLEPDTRILTNKGSLTAKDLHTRLESGEDIEAMSFNHVTGKTEFKKVIGYSKHKSEEDTFTLGSAAITSNHLVYTQEEGYLEASSATGKTGITLKME